MKGPSSAKSMIYRFDDFSVDASNFCVRRGADTVEVTPKAFDLLSFLVSNSSRVLEKQEIFDSVWSDAIVTDSALTKVIKELRHALGDSATEPRYIETIPKRGYRFISRVSLEAEGDHIANGGGDREWPIDRRRISFRTWTAAGVILSAIAVGVWLVVASSRNPQVSMRSIAVLPFKSLDPTSGDASLEIGMADTLINRLASVEDLSVRPIGVVRKYSDPQADPVHAGRETRSDVVLDGTIQRASGGIRVAVRLINVADGRQLWSEKFEEDFTEIFRVQDAIAERVATALALHLSSQERERLGKHPTENPEAYQLYLNAQLVWHGRRGNWIAQSLEFYRQAVEKDPQFALAYVGIADCYIMLNGHHKVPAEETVANAKPAILKALELDRTLAQAHNALAELKYQFEYDWAGAGADFQRAIELNPKGAWIRQAHGWYLMSLGRFDEAAAEMARAHELDPSSLTINVGRGRLYYYSRQYQRAIDHFENLIAVEPNDGSLKTALREAYEQAGMHRESVDMFLSEAAAGGMPPDRIERFRNAFDRGGWEGFLRERLARIRTREKSPDPVSWANVHVKLGQKDEAIAWLQKAVEAREPAVIQFGIDPTYDPLRDDARFRELIRSVGIRRRAGGES